MAKVRLLHGKPLMVGGKVALSDNCCCNVFPANCGNIPTVISTGYQGFGATRDDAVANAISNGLIGTGLESSLLFCLGTYSVFFGHYRWTTGILKSPGDPLTISTRYYILRYDTGDDFTNVGGTNATDTFFIATGTTPNIWISSSIIEDSGPIPPAGCQLRWLELGVFLASDCVEFCVSNFCDLAHPECITGTTAKSYTWDGSTTFSPWFEMEAPVSISSRVFGPFCVSHPAVWAPSTPT